jgi:hypothetical protein
MKTTFTRMLNSILRHPVLIAIVMMAIYLCVFQLSFVRTGDIWAEAYMEYLAKALETGWITVVMPSWEGYVTLLPSFFTELFVSSGASLALIDTYLRAITIMFTIGSLAVIASPLTKPLLPRLWQRLLVILALLMTLWHVSAFSFINIWYVGFIPLIVLALAAVKFTAWQKVVYTLCALCVAFTKPSIILLPFVVYRAVRTKEYITNGLIVVAIALQTYLLFFATSNGARNVVQGIWQIVHDMYIGMGTAVLKLLQFAPDDLLLVIANIALVLLFLLLILRLGWVRAGLLAFGFAFSVYAYVLAPTAEGVRPIADAGKLFIDHYKIQRETLISMFLVLSAGLLLPYVWSAAQRLPIRLQVWGRIAVLCSAGFGIGLLYRPIDTMSHQVAINIAPFRSSLALRQPLCMPVAPTPSWSPGTNWYMSYGGGCETKGLLTASTLENLTLPVGEGVRIKVPGHGKHSLMAVMVPLRLELPYRKGAVVIEDVKTGMRFTTQIRAEHGGGAQFVAFNTSGLAAQDSYEFILTTEVVSYTLIDHTRTTPTQAYFMLHKP